MGWDPQLAAFYGYVEDSEQQRDDELVVWLQETLSLDDLAAAIAPYARLRPELRAALEQDRKENSSYEGFGPWDDDWNDDGADPQ